MSTNDQSGYRRIPVGYDVKRWQHCLFVEIRKAPKYGKVLVNLRDSWRRAGRPGEQTGEIDSAAYWGLEELDKNSGYVADLGEAATALSLTSHGRPAQWAIQYLHADVLGHFLADKSPAMLALVFSRTIDIGMSASGGHVDTYMNALHDHRVRGVRVHPAIPMMIGQDEWQSLELVAKEAVALAVADIRTAFELDTSVHKSRWVPLGKENSRDVQIARLALRLGGRHGTRNSRKMDRRWCKKLRIDSPMSP